MKERIIAQSGSEFWVLGFGLARRSRTVIGQHCRVEPRGALRHKRFDAEETANER
jgi:hypothetical protein